ncbi:hypothetical protein Rsub_13304 [Raphidocelis subcapitata]|uniref:Methyltransferase type 11 domain-containing protein n=1 Tax=Raphidocelis subcapitata TaxID=307507 RepID=A0A2V0PL05_9CHLO|nr:hypothetical protein Rsub_13304 [Raphidocelis subcapitata]|eukprot:GBG00485.1 hypothetical protein Rsub_13304 [Raphidocelis subcapitata]
MLPPPSVIGLLILAFSSCHAAELVDGRGIKFNPCQAVKPGARASSPPANVYFNSNGSMYNILRAQKTLAFLRGIGAFAGCGAGAKPCAVVDIGAGQEAPRLVMKQMGLEHVAYLPVDYKARSPDTIVCNLNNIEFPHAQLEGYNVVGFLALGSLEYVIHRWALVASLAMYPNTVTVIHYQFGAIYSDQDFAWLWQFYGLALR